jgi:hypothetical protein
VIQVLVRTIIQGHIVPELQTLHENLLTSRQMDVVVLDQVHEVLGPELFHDPTQDVRENLPTVFEFGPFHTGWDLPREPCKGLVRHAISHQIHIAGRKTLQEILETLALTEPLWSRFGTWFLL